jgi:peptide-methionine (S)-S-oxide reductase
MAPHRSRHSERTTVVTTARPQPSDRDEGEIGMLMTNIPEGWSRAEIAGHPWAITRVTHAGGKAISLNAEQLDDTGQLGANVWITSKGTILRPCEIPAERVLQFLRAVSETH